MKMRLLVVNGLVLGAIGWLATVGGADVHATQLLPERGATPAAMAGLESQAGTSPTAANVSALAAAYLAQNQSGLATAVIERAPVEVRAAPEVAQLYSRALFHRGHSRDALAVARQAQDACGEGCAPWLIAKTTGQVAFLEQVVAAGIEDPQDDPAATRAAYDRSSREVGLVAMR